MRVNRYWSNPHPKDTPALLFSPTSVKTVQSSVHLVVHNSHVHKAFIPPESNLQSRKLSFVTFCFYGHEEKSGVERNAAVSVLNYGNHVTVPGNWQNHFNEWP